MTSTKNDLPERMAAPTVTAILLLIAAGCVATGVHGPVQGWWEDRGPVIPHETFPMDCGVCHEGEDWNTLRADFSFDHEKETGVALVGTHKRAQCLRCHNDRGPVQAFAQRGCQGCHEDIHQGQLGVNCKDCHNQVDWQPGGQIAMHARTRFPLVGAHAATACRRCHPGALVGKFVPTSADCESCHQNDLARATSPNHVAQGWTNDCQRCHIPTSWAGAGFSHSSFALVGGHAAANCNDCHQNDQFAGTPSNCDACHLNDFNGTTNPNHVGSGFSTDCQVCHNVFGWTGANFVHTVWPLTGAHVGTDCQQCHVNGQYTGTPTQCSGCHLPDFNGATNPNHVQSGFSQDCEICHTTSGWTGANFNHNVWPLTGAHSGAACSQCHQNGVFSGTPNNCVDCHLTQYNGTTSPPHQASGYSTNCDNCHDTTNWNNATVNHNAFPLTGAHAGASCTQCHTGGVYAGLPSNCVDCHLTQYNNTTTPNHQAAGFPTTCDSCHDTVNWNNATFNHSFPRTGPHNRPCTDCHLNPGNYQQFSCTHCHKHRQSAMNSHHNNVQGYVWQSSACLSCHPNGNH